MERGGLADAVAERACAVALCPPRCGVLRVCGKDYSIIDCTINSTEPRYNLCASFLLVSAIFVYIIIIEGRESRHRDLLPARAQHS